MEAIADEVSVFFAIARMGVAGTPSLCQVLESGIRCTSCLKFSCR
ncbi:hypothetical protein GXM_10196 [Nostoc sphaeroides CCNUC1]|uniref:Uncharacterized protein n=1 Tax=Nostoc sphaeroides CCNUC1 TaxID=2653204 RepID=A0A5P8WKF1_9NOSO|nr:hypothetical protein GXM_10196 [Nostoc sphaeroides CCNUC1]